MPATSIVSLLWVMTMNWVSSDISRSSVDEAQGVDVVERRVDLVEDAEGRGLGAEEREEQRDRGQRLLAAGHQHQVLQPLARRAGDDLDAALQQVLLVEQAHLGLAAAEEAREGLAEVRR